MLTVTAIHRASLIAFLIALGTALGEEVNSPGDNGEEECFHGGFMLRPESWAGISTEQCANHTVFELKEITERRAGRRVQVTRDVIKVPLSSNEYAAGCWDGQNFTGVIVLVRTPIINYREPEILRAWKVDLLKWKIREIPTGTTPCRLYGPVGDVD